MTGEEFAEGIALLSASIGKPIAKDMARAWFAILEDLTVDQFRKGIVETMRTHQFAGFPPVGVVRKNAIGGIQSATIETNDRAIVAFAAVKRAVAEHGGYATVSFDDPIANATIRALGGWVAVCDTPEGQDFDTWLAKRFYATYAAMMHTGVQAVEAAPLPGICDSTNSKTGEEKRLTAVIVSTSLPKLPATLVRGEMPKRIESHEIKRIAHEAVSSLGLPPAEEKPVVRRLTIEEQQERKQQQIAELNEKYLIPVT